MLALLLATVLRSTLAAEPIFDHPIIELVHPGEVVGDGLTPVTLSLVALDQYGDPVDGLMAQLTGRDSGTFGEIKSVGPGLYQVQWTPRKSEPITHYLTYQGKTESKLKLRGSWTVDAVRQPTRMMSMTANPGQLVLGRDRNANIGLTLTGDDLDELRAEDLDIRCTTGEVVNVTLMGPGQFTALYNTPEDKKAGLAVIAVTHRADPLKVYGWAVIRLIGEHEQTIQARKGTSVLVKTAGRTFGPFETDAKGRAKAVFDLAPGVVSVDVDILEGSDRTTQQLAVPGDDVTTTLIFAMPGTVPGDPNVAVPVRVLRLTADGKPDSTNAPDLAVDKGTITGLRLEGNGIWSATWTPPASAVEEVATLTAGGDVREVTLVPVRPAGIGITPSPNPVGTDPFELTVVLTSPTGDALAERQVKLVVDGAKELTPLEDRGDGTYVASYKPVVKAAMVARASVGTPTSTNDVRALVGVTSHPRLPNDALSSARITFLALDEFGYPVANVPIELSLAKGTGSIPAKVNTGETGLAQISYTASRDIGLVDVRATTGGHSASVTILQLPADVRPELTELPPSGAPADIELRDAWEVVTKTIKIDRAR